MGQTLWCYLYFSNEDTNVRVLRNCVRLAQILGGGIWTPVWPSRSQVLATIFIPTRNDGLATELCLCPSPESLRVVRGLLFGPPFNAGELPFLPEDSLGHHHSSAQHRSQMAVPGYFIYFSSKRGIHWVRQQESEG